MNNRCSMKNSLIRKKMRVSFAVASLTWHFPLFLPPFVFPLCLFVCSAFFIGTRTCHFLRKSPGEPMELEPITSSTMTRREGEREKDREDRMILRLWVCERTWISFIAGIIIFIIMTTYISQHPHTHKHKHTHTWKTSAWILAFHHLPLSLSAFLSPVVCLCFF